MNKSAIILILVSLLLIIAQAVVFNHVSLWGVAMPFVFIYILVKLPVNLSLSWLFTISFAVGLIIDIFSDTMGMNALACTLTMALRRPIIHLYFNRDEEISDAYPGIKTFGTFTFTKYVLTLTLVYCSLFFFIEAFSVFRITRLLTCIGASTLLTTILIICIDSLTVRKGEKRL